MRSAFDKLISWTGILLAIVLLIAAGLLTWAYVFIGNEVNDQLTMQDITMPEGDDLKSLPDADREALEPYAGSELDSGPEARAYADHYILVHMNEASGGKSYSEVSGQYVSMTPEEQASEEGQQLAGLRQTLFMGNTLRGLLLYGYAFATIGTICGIAAAVAFVGAIVLLVLAILGLRHAHRSARAEQAAEAPPAAPAAG